jgi:hypothetical protein
VLPTAIAAAAGKLGPSGALTANAAITTPGTLRQPRSSTQTTAIPVGGQNGVTWPRTNAGSRPMRAPA